MEARLSGRDIVCFSNDWDGDPLSKMHAMKILARQNRVLWVNSIGNRKPNASTRDLQRILKKVRGAAEGVRERHPNLFVLTPLAIPFYGSELVRAANGALLRAQVKRDKLDAERALGHAVVDVSAQHCGWDITSIPPVHEGKLPPSRHIEVKGRAKGQTTITVTRNEILYGLNQAEKFILAVVLVEGDRYEGPFYVKNPFTQEPDWAVTSINLDLDQLLVRAAHPA